MKTYLKDTHPELFSEVDTSTNTSIDLNKLSTSYSKPITWICPLGHAWEKSPFERTRIRINKKTGTETKGSNCPYCSNHRILKGFNDMATTDPELAKRFHPTKNLPLTIYNTGAGSAKLAWWVCDEGHEWEAGIYNTSQTKIGCAVCANQSVLTGFNDLATTNPTLASQWHDAKNGELKPTDITAGANRSVWWQCGLGHEWEAVIASRGSTIGRNRGCPICSNRKVLIGYNNLAKTHPELIPQLDLTTTPDIKIEDLHAGSSKKVGWICSKDSTHKWVTSIEKRAKLNQGCPLCSNRVSLAETEVADWVTSLLGPSISIIRNDRKILPDNKELDIYIPSLKFAIEYNGFYWHSEDKVGTSIHYKKWKACKEAGIQLFSVWEDYWLENKDLTKRMLSVKLGAGDPSGKIFARKTIISEVPNKAANNFLSKNHLQGPRISSKFYGLYEEDNPKELVALLGILLTEGGKVAEISRFASSKRVVGGFSKLLKHAILTNIDVERIFTYSDNNISLGQVYEINGFTEKRDNIRSYFYAINQKRVHRRKYTKEKYRTNPALKFDASLSESKLASLNKLDRVWDSGNTRWELTVVR